MHVRKNFKLNVLIGVLIGKYGLILHFLYKTFQKINGVFYIRQICLLFFVLIFCSLLKRGTKFQVNNSVINGPVFDFRCLDRPCSNNMFRPPVWTLWCSLESWGWNIVMFLCWNHWLLGQINAHILFSWRSGSVLNFVAKHDDLRL